MRVNWTKENDLALIKLVGKGMRTQTISNRMECTQSAVCSRVHKLGYRYEQIVKLTEMRKTPEQILAESPLYTGEKGVNNYTRIESARVWTKPRCIELIGYVEKGFADKGIARKMNAKVNSIDWAIRYAVGLTREEICTLSDEGRSTEEIFEYGQQAKKNAMTKCSNQSSAIEITPSQDSIEQPITSFSELLSNGIFHHITALEQRIANLEAGR